MPTVHPSHSEPSADERRQAVLAAIAQGPRLMYSAARLTSTPHDAEDAYQRAMVIALTKAPTVDPDEFLAWLHVVVRNEARDVARSRAREGPAAEADVAETAAETLASPHSVHRSVSWRERYRALDEALENLTEAQKVCLILQCAGETYEGIQRTTGYSLRKIERSVLEGRRALRRWQVELLEGVVCERMADLISRTVDGVANRRELRRVSKHVSHCGACRARYRNEREMRAGLAALAPAPLIATIPLAAPDPSPMLAWWDRLTQGATVHTGTATQAMVDLSGSGVVRVGAGTVALAVAGIAGLPLVVDAVDALDAPAPRPAAVRPAAIAASPPSAVATPAQPAVATQGAHVRIGPAPARPATVAARQRRVPAPRPARARAAPPPPRTPSPSVAPTSPRPSYPAPSGSSLALEFGP